MRGVRSYTANLLPASAHLVEPDRILSNGERFTYPTGHLANRRQTGVRRDKTSMIALRAHPWS